MNVPAADATPRRTAPDAGPSPVGEPTNGDDRRSMVAQAAYHRAEQRGFAPGHELDDWLAAEAEVDRPLAAQDG